MNRGASVSLRSVGKRFGGTEAVSDFSLEIRPSEIVTLLGPSGSGKSTVLNMLAGFSDASDGVMMIDGAVVNDLPPEKRNIGMVFQSPALFPNMSVAKNVAFPLDMRGIRGRAAKARVGRALEMVRLTGYEERMPGQLSGGQQQRVALARAIVFEPPLLLMDESLSALDLKLREAMQVEIRELHREIRSTIIFVTHDQTEALILSDRVAIMNGGRLVQVDTPANIYDKPKGRFVADFIGHTNILRAVRLDEARLDCETLGLPIPFRSTRARTVLSLRPENVLLLDPGGGVPAADVELDANVDDIVVTGSQVTLYLATGGTCLLECRLDRNAMRKPVSVGDRIRCGFKTGSLVEVDDD